VLAAPASLTLWDIAADGSVLFTRDEERKAVMGQPPGESRERDLSWLDGTGLAALSADGRSLLFDDRFGVYLRSTDGSLPMELGVKDAFADDLSPNGETILATSADNDRLMLVPRRGGDPRPLPNHGIGVYKGARWFPSGERVLFTGSRPGEQLRSYIQDLDGRPPRAITPAGSWALSISPDGKEVAVIQHGPGISIWPVEGDAPPRAVPGSREDDRPTAWHRDGRSLWVFHRDEVPAPVFRVDIASGRRVPWRDLQPPDLSGVYSIIDLEITPDGSAYVYSYARLLSQLYVARGLR
jgi:WD40 repeat protein